jgi:hypothetical protein
MSVKNAQNVLDEHPLYLSSFVDENGKRKYTVIYRGESVMADTEDLDKALRVLEKTAVSTRTDMSSDYWDGVNGCFVRRTPLASGEKKRYTVTNSSIFNTEKYDIEKIKQAVKKAGGSNIRVSNNFGWSNQPKVVTFDASEFELNSINKAVSEELGGSAKTLGVIIREQDW